MNALDDLFRDEVDRQAYLLREGLQHCERLPPNGEMLFAAQALKGAARVVGVTAAERLADGIELLLGAAESASGVLDAVQLQACNDAVELLEAIAQAGSARANEVASATQLSDLLSRLATPVVGGRIAAPKVKVLSGLPAITLNLFRQECDLNANTLSEGLLSLEQQPNQPNVLDKLMRAAHSIKGAARAVGLDATVTLAHAAEEQLERVRLGQVRMSPELIDALLAASDLFQRIGTSVSSGFAVPADSLVMSCSERIALASVGGAFHANDETAPGDNDEANSATVERPVSLETSQPTPALANEDDRILRIRAGQLSRIVGLSGELVVEVGQMRALAAAQQRMRIKHTQIADLIQDLQQSMAVQPGSYAARSGIENVRIQLNELRISGNAWSEQFDQYAVRNEDLSTQLYRQAMDSRMRPIADCLAMFPRLVRDIAKRLGKQAALVVSGETHRIDRDILERIEAPLNHMLRNALDHGLEKPTLRRERGKPEQGLLAINISTIAGSLYVTVSDDGAGIDTEKVRNRVVAMGLASPEVAQQLTEDRLLDHLFTSGFSTADHVTEISGRGVGLAVVRSVMLDIGGSVHVQTKRNEGVRFQLRMPVSRTVQRAVVVSIAGGLYALELARIDRLARIDPSQVQFSENCRYIVMDGRTVTLVAASEVLDLGLEPEPGRVIPLVVVHDLGHSIGFVVETILSEQDIVLLPLDIRLGRVPHLSAAAVLGDGRPVLVLNAEEMVRSVLQQQGISTSSDRTPSVQTRKVSKRVLVVDDSPTVQAMERDLLIAAGYEVVTANDGMEALQLLKRSNFGLILTDIDMPRLDGLGLIRLVRQDLSLTHIPVVVLSFRASAEDRRRGLDAGANVYLTKVDFSDRTLLNSVIQLIGDS